MSMKRTLSRWLVVICLVGSWLLTGCNNQDAAFSRNPNSPPATASPSAIAPLPRLKGTATVVLTLEEGPVTLEVDGNQAPLTAGNFVDLVARGVYDNTVFHRVIREPQPFVAQGGDPQSKDEKVPVSELGTGSFIDPATSQPRYIPLEITPKGAKEPTYSQVLNPTQEPVLKHRRGAVAMARANPPDSASAQFYIALGDLPFLDGSYAVFGKVTEGMDVVDKIQQGDRLESAKVVSGLENLQK